MRILVTHEIEVKKKWLTLDTLILDSAKNDLINLSGELPEIIYEILGNLLFRTLNT